MSPISKLEFVLLNERKEGMIEFVEDNTDIFEELLNLAISNKRKVSWRAAWVLGHTTREHDKRLQTHILTIIKSIDGKVDGHQRELLKILEKNRITEECESPLFDTCLSIWQDIYKKPGTRVTALRHLIKIAKKYPELRNEIFPLLDERYIETLSPGIKQVVLKMVGELEAR